MKTYLLNLAISLFYTMMMYLIVLSPIPKEFEWAYRFIMPILFFLMLITLQLRDLKEKQ